MSLEISNEVGLKLRKYKIVLLGEQGVGKTCIITRFMYDCYDGTYQATIGIDFLSKTIHLNGKHAQLQIWDTAGQERFRSLIPSYIRGSHAAIVVYNMSELKSFQQARYWIDSVKTESNCISIFLVGNSLDIYERKIKTEEGEKLAQEFNIPFIETSAKTGQNVKELFRAIAETLPAEDESPNMAVDFQAAKQGCSC